MKKKKPEPPAATAVPKAGLYKRIERRFFKIFNDKTAKRRKALLTLMLIPSAFGMSHVWHDDPSTDRQAGGAEQVRDYTQEISQIARDTKAFAITPDGVVVRGDAAQLVALDKRIQALANQLVLDTKISEQDALDLTRQFMREINSPVVGPQLLETLSALTENAAFIQDARDALIRSGATQDHPGMRAAQILNEADNQSDGDYFYDFLIGFLLMKLLFGDNLLAMIRRGSRRNDVLQRQEDKEIYTDRLIELREMLKPKTTAQQSPTKPTTPPQPPKI